MNRNALLLLAFLAVIGVGVGVFSHNFPTPPTQSVGANDDVATSASSSTSELLDEVEEVVDRSSAVANEIVTPAVGKQLKSTASLIVEVRSSGGAPVRSARVVFVRDEKILAKRSTGKDGQVLLRGLGRDVDVFVLTGRVLRVRRHLDDAVGSHVLAFPQGATLRGTVLIDSMPPKGSLQLTLRLNDTTGFELPPSFVQQQQSQPGGVEDKPYLTTWAGPAGYFEFADVPPTCTGTMEVPWDYWWENDADPLKVDDVTRELVVRLETPPAITGRIVKPGTREGARARIRYEVAASGRHDSMDFTGDLVTNAGGRFQYDFPRRRIARFAATVHVEGVGQTTLDIRDVPPRGLDLGDIALVAGEEVYFVVHDVDGKPIEDAIASTLDEPPLQSHATDASGRGSFASLPPTLNSIRVRALGYRSVVQRVVTRTPTDDTPIAVTLERLPQLNVAVQQSDGAPARGVAVQLSSRDAALFVDDDGAASRMPVQLDLGATYPDVSVGGRSDFGREVAYAVDENGRARILGLNPHALLTIRVIDKTGAPLVEQGVESALLQSSDPLVLRLDVLARTLELLVIDRDRQPIDGATVSLRGKARTLATTQSNGLAQVTPIYGHRVELVVVAPGFAPTPLVDLTLEKVWERREVVMMRGYSVRVRVIDTDGKELAANDVDAAVNFHPVGTVSRCPDEPCFLVEDLPPDPVQLFVDVMGASLFRVHDPRDPVATLKVPEHGSLLIEFSEPITDPVQYTVTLEPGPNEDGTIPEENGIFSLLSGSRPLNSFALPLVFSGRYAVVVHGPDPSNGERTGWSRTENVVVRTGERTVMRAVITR